MHQKSSDKTSNPRPDNLRIKKAEQKLNAPKVEPNLRSSNRKTNGTDGSAGATRGSNH